MSAPQNGPTRAPARRRLLVLLAALLVVAGVAGWLAVSSRSDGGSSAAAGTSSAPDAPATAPASPTPVDLGTAQPTDVPQTVLVNDPQLPSNLPPVALASPSSFGNGVSARLAGIGTFSARAQRPGEISGPALAVTVELTNGGSAAASLDTVTVNVYYGAAGTPAVPVADGTTASLHGPLAPGASDRATYAFSVPTDQRGDVTVAVSYGDGSGTAVFSGAVS